eukprot:m51a1_g251 hypothetical protein (1279) ;mRNA; f:189548-196201
MRPGTVSSVTNWTETLSGSHPWVPHRTASAHCRGSRGPGLLLRLRRWCHAGLSVRSVLVTLMGCSLVICVVPISVAWYFGADASTGYATSTLYKTVSGSVVEQLDAFMSRAETINTLNTLNARVNPSVCSDEQSLLDLWKPQAQQMITLANSYFIYAANSDNAVTGAMRIDGEIQAAIKRSNWTVGSNIKIATDPEFTLLGWNASWGDGYYAPGRPWYQNALEQSGQSTWSDVYVFWDNKGLGVTVSQTMERNGTVCGVVAVDFLLTGIAQFLQNMPVDFGAEVWIFQQTGEIIASSVPGETYFVQLNDSVTRYTVRPGLGVWCVAIAVPTSKFYSQLQSGVYISIGVSAAVLVVAVAASVILGLVITRPIKHIASDLKAVATLSTLSDSQTPRSHLSEIDSILSSASMMKRMIVSMTKYIPISVMHWLIDNDRVAELGMSPTHCAIMFTDIVNFTQITDTVSPRVLIKVFTDVMDASSAAIVATGGIVDKIVGDSVMGVWGTPTPVDAPELSACRTALNTIGLLEKLQPTWEAQGLPCFRLRVGIASGKVLAGNCGSSDRFCYTVLGNAVNLASRLESLNKYYGSTVMVCERTAGKVKDAVLMRKLETVRVKGQARPLEVYEIFESSGEGAITEDACATFTNAARQRKRPRSIAELSVRSVLVTLMGCSLVVCVVPISVAWYLGSTASTSYATSTLYKTVSGTVKEQLDTFVSKAETANTLNTYAARVNPAVCWDEQSFVDQWKPHALEMLTLDYSFFIYAVNSNNTATGAMRVNDEVMAAIKTSNMSSGSNYRISTDPDFELLEWNATWGSGFYAPGRAWYQKALANPGQTTWSKVYVWPDHKRLGVTVSQTMERNGTVCGVVAVDFLLTGIAQFLQNMPVDFGAEVWIFQQTGEIIASSATGENFSTRELGRKLRSRVSGLATNESVEFSSNLWGARHQILLSSFQIRSGLGVWCIAIATPRSHLSEIDSILSSASMMKRMIVSMTKYIPISVMHWLIDNDRVAELGMSPTHCAIMFTDIVNFTQITDTVPPRDLIKVFTEVMDASSAAIVATGGIVDKIVGDSVMGVWGAPKRVEAPELSACRAALSIVAMLEKLQPTWEAQGLPCFRLRVGIASGKVLAGNCGSSDRFCYTVLGNAVNLASRLESLNKYYGSTVMVCERTAGKVKDAMLMRKLETVRVKGQETPLEVYEVFPRATEGSEAAGVSEDECATFTNAVNAYEQQNFVGAVSLFKQFMETKPDDQHARAMIEKTKRCLDHVKDPDRTFDFVHTFETK